MTRERHLVWFRHDLRLRDNPALYAACQNENAEVIAVWCITPRQWQKQDISGRQLKFLYDSLCLLQKDLSEHGIPLQILISDDYRSLGQDLQHYCQQHSINRLFYNYQYEVNEAQRDKRIQSGLHDGGILCQGFHEATLLPPGAVLSGQGKMYQVFTPFANAMVRQLKDTLPECYPMPAVRKNRSTLESQKIPQFYPAFAEYDQQIFPPGHDAALKKLRQFSQGPVSHYAKGRDLPAAEATSRLSAALATGLLSARQCLLRILHDHPQALDRGAPQFTWINELIWRDFYRHLLVAEPRLCQHQPFQRWTEHIQWRKDQSMLTAWKSGQTGFPIVDAGMRQLNQSGWMHNRLRMICASFLVKDLLIDWRDGERYFATQLIDIDLAANNGGWQWAASTGTDAAPYFRIFNPQRQGERFDPQGAFIRQWISELKAVPETSIHHPWTWADKQRVTLDYPRAVVDHSAARKYTLAAFEAAKRDL